MKLKDLKIKQDRARTNKSDVYIDYQVDVHNFADYKGKNPMWAIFFIDKEKDPVPYKVRWMDYDGWREDENCNFKTFKEAASYLYEQIQLEIFLVSRGGWVKYSEDYD